jgi:hypothetical protein
VRLFSTLFEHYYNNCTDHSGYFLRSPTSLCTDLNTGEMALTQVTFDIRTPTTYLPRDVQLCCGKFAPLRWPSYRRVLSMGRSGIGNVQLLWNIELARLQCSSSNQLFLPMEFNPFGLGWIPTMSTMTSLQLHGHACPPSQHLPLNSMIPFHLTRLG